MGKNKLIKNVAEMFKMKPERMRLIINAFLKEIEDALLRGEWVHLREFISLQPKLMRRKRFLRRGGGRWYVGPTRMVSIKTNKRMRDLLNPNGIIITEEK